MKMLLASTMLAMMCVAALAEETPPVPAPEPVQAWTCSYDLFPTGRIAALNVVPLARPATKEEVRLALGVIPCSLHGTTPIVANAQGGEAKIRSEDGKHYYPRVIINGTPVRMLADTGATLVALSAEDARKVGIDPQSLQFTGQAHTANGPRPAAPITLSEITIEGTVLRNVRASCCVTGESLLGMSALERFNFTMNNGLMVLSPKR
jgi:clan AA aspartic protease (TIGR02281 family)